MNSFAKYVIDNGGHEYDIIYPPRALKGEYSSCNTGCVWYGGKLVLNTRLVNYIKRFQNRNIVIDKELNLAQTYIYPKDHAYSRNIMSKYSDGAITESVEMIYPKSDVTDTVYLGLEDARLVRWDNKLYAYGTRWDKVKDDGCICIYEITGNRQSINEIVVKPMSANRCEKNWAAVSDQPFTFVYLQNPIQVVKVDRHGGCSLIKTHPKIDCGDYVIKGSTPIVRFDNDRYMSLVHSNKWYKAHGLDRNDYVTAIAFYDNDLKLIELSNWFVFKRPMCEFTCGLEIHGDDVYVTYSQFDCTSHLLVTSKKTIEDFMKIHTDLDNQCTLMEYYIKAKEYEMHGLFNTAAVLYNYVVVLSDDELCQDEIKLECLIKTYLSLVNSAGTHWFKGILEGIMFGLETTIKDYPQNCEFYYMMCRMCKIIGNSEESSRYKQLGDERKETMHKYFLRHFNPNYL